MALVDKLQRGLKSRYLPFFFPVIATLAYIGIVILVMPNELGKDAGETETLEGSDASTSGSATPGSGPNVVSSRRRTKTMNRPGIKSAAVPNGMPDGMGNPGAAMPVAPPQPMPASPDGAD